MLPKISFYPKAMSNQVYTSEELAGKWIVCFPVLSGKRPCLDCVRYSKGYRNGLPYLYNSKEEAKSDQFFDPDWDEIVKAEEYFRRIQK